MMDNLEPVRKLENAARQIEKVIDYAAQRKCRVANDSPAMDTYRAALSAARIWLEAQEGKGVISCIHSQKQDIWKDEFYIGWYCPDCKERTF